LLERKPRKLAAVALANKMISVFSSGQRVADGAEFEPAADRLIADVASL
jgi:hypothetical protein